MPWGTIFRPLRMLESDPLRLIAILSVGGKAAPCVSYHLILSPKGASYHSPGQRPGFKERLHPQALKGRARNSGHYNCDGTRKTYFAPSGLGDWFGSALNPGC